MALRRLEFKFDEGEELVTGGSRVVGLYRLRRKPTSELQSVLPLDTAARDDE